MRRVFAVVALATSLLSAGCAVSNSVTGRATKEIPAELFDPCTLPDDALRNVNVDPATAAADFLGVQSEGWELCSWRSDWYFLSIFTTDTTVEELRTRPKNTDFRPVEVGTRDAVTFRSIYESEADLCDLTYPSSAGTVIIRVSTRGTKEQLEDPCAVSVRTARALDSFIPV